MDLHRVVRVDQKSVQRGDFALMVFNAFDPNSWRLHISRFKNAPNTNWDGFNFQKHQHWVISILDVFAKAGKLLEIVSLWY